MDLVETTIRYGLLVVLSIASSFVSMSATVVFYAMQGDSDAHLVALYFPGCFDCVVNLFCVYSMNVKQSRMYSVVCGCLHLKCQRMFYGL